MLDDDRTEREARRCKYAGEEVNLGHVSIATCAEHRIFRFHNFSVAKRNQGTLHSLPKTILLLLYTENETKTI